jgi:opacity protein-like surface antigen
VSVKNDSENLLFFQIQKRRGPGKKEPAQEYEMKIAKGILFAMILIFATTLAAQDRFEIFAEYSYLRFSPTISGLNSRNFNGGGTGIQLNFLKILGLKADFMGYGQSTFTTTVNGVTYSATADMFTYTAGPVFRIPLWRVKPFGEVLFGASHTNGYANLRNAIAAGGVTISRTPTQNPFTMVAGGGVDIAISHHVALRPGEFDYVLSRYSNPLTSTNNQHNFRYCGGLIFKF